MNLTYAVSIKMQIALLKNNAGGAFTLVLGLGVLFCFMVSKD
jgi:hypothetical protein